MSWVCLLVLLLVSSPLVAQRELAGTAKVKLALERLQVMGTVLMIAAHPDDENTALLAYFARGRKLRTAYLSLTRGEGGQNLIGAERGDLMGVIRTQELLAARRVDGAEQFFTRAIDFGYSKTAEETLAKWGKEEVLGDVVWVIRKLRPDIIVLRFSGTPRDGHGHHQSSGMLGKEAFRAAADPQRFPEQLKHVEPWQAKRIFWNVFSFRRGGFTNEGDMADRVDVDTGEFSPLLGFSYAEIAGMSRSMHRSQGFGAPLRKGPSVNSLVLVDGEPAKSDPLEGIDTTWNRVAGGAKVGETLARANDSFDPKHPEKIVPLLLEARREMAKLSGPDVVGKRAELDETIALAAGLWLDAAAERSAVTPGSKLKVAVTALNRSPFPLELLSVELDGAGVDTAAAKLGDNRPVTKELEWDVPADQPYSQPYWLREEKGGNRYHIADAAMIGQPDTEPTLMARFRIRAGDQDIEYRRPVIYRWVDRVRGELTEPMTVVPPVSVEFAEEAALFPTEGAKRVEVQVSANADNAVGELRLSLPQGWSATPGTQSFKLSNSGEQVVLAFEVTPPASTQMAQAKAIATAGGVEISSAARVINYTHIPPQTLTLKATADLVRVDAKMLARRVGYVTGAGDDVPHALRELGCEVTLLESEDLARADLSRFDAIVTGIRAYNTRTDLVANQQRLLDYVEDGGTLVVQYNVTSRFRRGRNGPDPLARVGPYPLRIGRGRVSVEEAPMRFLDPDHVVLQKPNRITEADFEGWVQERGLYFAQEWDDQYEPLWEANDPGEDPLAGSTLYARHGKGVYIFTGLSWFRQLPAGVPGAYRIFANLLSAGKTIP